MQTQTLKEVARRAAPAGRPQPLAFLGGTLWLGSWDSDHIYGIDPKTWTVTADVAAPGKPYGLAVAGDGLRAVISIGDDDDRYLYRFSPATGFDESSKTECPEFTGSHLASDGGKLYLGQMGLRRILELDANDQIVRTIALPTRIGGMGFGPGGFYVIAADEEFDHLQFAKLDITQETPQATILADMDAEARSLAYDGTNWWTNYREAGQTVTFSLE